MASITLVYIHLIAYLTSCWCLSLIFSFTYRVSVEDLRILFFQCEYIYDNIMLRISNTSNYFVYFILIRLKFWVTIFLSYSIACYKNPILGNSTIQVFNMHMHVLVDQNFMIFLNPSKIHQLLLFSNSNLDDNSIKELSRIIRMRFFCLALFHRNMIG